MEMTDIEFEKDLAEFGEIPYVVELKYLIDSYTGDKEKLLDFWRAGIIKKLREDPENGFKHGLYVWFMVNYFPNYKGDSKKIWTNNSIILDFLEDYKNDTEILKRRKLNEYCIRDIVKNESVDLETLRDDINDKLSAFPNRRSLHIDKHIVTKMEKENQLLNVAVLESKLSTPCLKEIYQYLTKLDKGLKTDEITFLFWFGRSEPENPKPMNWKGTRQLLVNVLHQICVAATAKKQFLKAFEIEKLPNAHTDYKNSKVCTDIESKIKRFNK